FWLGEAPARTREVSAAVARIREEGGDARKMENALGLPTAAAEQVADYVSRGVAALGAAPTPGCVVAERFFDESGGMQLVLHAPFGGRVNRAWGLALRKKFCRGFGFELQAAANEEAILISLGPQHSFPLEEVFDYLQPETARDVLIQALLASPLFATRWRWNATRSLLLSRTRQGGRRVPAPLLRMRADDLLAAAFPQVLACGETLPPGDLPIPWEQPIVRQTIEDCLNEAMDVEGFLDVLHGLRDGRIRRLAVDTAEPSPFALGILNAMPYAFLDDAPLEERRAQAVSARRGLAPKLADTLGALDDAAVARVKEEAWPQPEDEEELHEALGWMGHVSPAEAAESGWTGWLQTLAGQGRVRLEDGLWRAAESSRDPGAALRGRMEALGPVAEDALDEPTLLLLRALEKDGVVLRCRVGGRAAWCDRRLLARAHRYTLDRLRQEIEPVPAAAFWRFLAVWQHVDADHRLDGPRGVVEAIRQLAGFESAAAAWESGVLSARVRGYRPEWLDQAALTGEVAWGRLWGAGASAIRATPICLLPREDLPFWLRMAERARTTNGSGAGISSHGAAVLKALHERGALFPQELERACGLLPSHLEMGLSELIGHGAITCDSFGGLRRLIRPKDRHVRDRVRPAGARAPLMAAGRWSLFGPTAADPFGESAPAARDHQERPDEADVDFAARRLLDRYGVIFRRLLAREKIPIPWRDLARRLRHLELTGEVRGGRFVAGFAGEQFALPRAVELLRRQRRRGTVPQLSVPASDPLNLAGILTPSGRVPSAARRRVQVG
ncbi:MAG TPA: hypothetical protein VFP98_03965, partial [Candidatus Polarisedimenticolia bacterium]|nr:hypothetical protein [Candidatus Polarisedimenticolia bacterium]